MKGSRKATAARAGHPLGYLPRLAALVLVGLITVLGSVYVWADRQAAAEARGQLVAETLTQDIGAVPFDGGLAKARFALKAQGGPVVVKDIATT